MTTKEKMKKRELDKRLKNENIKKKLKKSKKILNKM